MSRYTVVKRFHRKKHEMVWVYYPSTGSPDDMCATEHWARVVANLTEGTHSQIVYGGSTIELDPIADEQEIVKRTAGGCITEIPT